MTYFENLHPICILLYFAAVIGLTLTCFHPVMLLVSLLGALAFLIRLKGGCGAVRHLSFVIPMSLLVAIANPLINHRGVTLLGLFLNQWITLEAIAYGITAGLSLAALILWFGCYSEVMTSEKFLYLFGKIAPASALLISMALQLVPKLNRQLTEIRESQEMLRPERKNLSGKLGTALRHTSTLVGWSLEGAVEQTDSMKARGYGLRRRTTFHLFHFDSRDLRFFCGVMILFGVCVIARAFGHGTMEFYPADGCSDHRAERNPALHSVWHAGIFTGDSGRKGGACMALLRFDKVSFAYPDAKTRALDQVSFSMEEGEYLVVCGESGCGKTTLLRQAKPELTPAGARDGSVYYMDQPLAEVPDQVSAMEIGYVQQNPDNQIVTDYVWHELAFGLENMALPTSTTQRKVSEMASFFGMEEWFRKKTSELSGGQKQMLNMASIMAMNPKLLILDEPTSMLDPLAARNLLDTIARINRELGVAVLLCEHRLEDVFQRADRVLLMKQGSILADDTPENLTFALQRDPTASRIYLGLPGAARIFGELQKEGICPADRKLPLSIRDARRILKELDLPFEKMKAETEKRERNRQEAVKKSRFWKERNSGSAMKQKEKMFCGD